MQSALSVGGAISSAAVDAVEAGFEEEHLELLPAEVQEMQGFSMGGGEVDGEDEDEA